VLHCGYWHCLHTVWNRLCASVGCLSVCPIIFFYCTRSSKKTHTNKDHTKPDALPQSTNRNTTHRPTTNQTLRNRKEHWNKRLKTSSVGCSSKHSCCSVAGRRCHPLLHGTQQCSVLQCAAGSAMLSAYVGGWTQTCYFLSPVLLTRWTKFHYNCSGSC